MSRRLLTALVLIAMSCCTLAHAEDRQLLIVLRSSQLVEPPKLENGQIVCELIGGKVPVQPITSAVSLQYLYRGQQNNPANRGPWVVALVNIDNVQALVDSLRQNPLVGWVAAYADSTDALMETTLGEAAKPWFPDESQLGGAFCQSQTYLHFPNPSEVPSPTLLEAGLDSCAWYVDGQGSYPEEEWPNQWYSPDLDLPQAWAITQGSPGVVTATMDHGVEWRHPDLGGSGPSEDSNPIEVLMEAYRNGAIYHHGVEEVGDANDDGYSGLGGVDDDGDGTIDEDPWGLLPDNIVEQDVAFGVCTSRDTFVLNDGSAAWDSSVIGYTVVPKAVGAPSNGYTVVAATDTSLTLDIPETVIAVGGMLVITQPGTQYMISDGEDSDGDGVVDDWWAYDPSDDDENGYPDDMKGWDFFQFDAGPSGSLVKTTDVPGDWDVSPGYSGVQPSPQHGTHVVGALAALANGQGTVGTAPQCKFIPYRIRTGTGLLEEDGRAVADLAAAIHHARKLRDENGERVADIITLSLGLTHGNQVPPHWTCESFTALDPETGAYLHPVAAEIGSALSEGIVVLVGAGNTDSYLQDPYWISCFDDVISVGGSNGTAPWSGWGSAQGYGTAYGPWVDIAAPAMDIATTHDCRYASTPCDEDYGLTPTETSLSTYGWVLYATDGTSMSTPLVAGIAALMKSSNPELSSAELRRKLIWSVDPLDYTDVPVSSGELGRGRVNAYKALTNYGNIPAAQPDTTWANTVWISGDITTPTATTLYIEPGTTVKIAQDDILDSGEFGTQIEWKINGSVSAGAPGGAPVVFEVFSDSPDSLWGPIVINRVLAGTLAFNNVEFRGLVRDHLTFPTGGESFAPGDTVMITWSTDWGVTHEIPAQSYIDSVRIELSLDGGSNFADLAASVGHSAGSYQWTPGISEITEEAALRLSFYTEERILLGSDTTDPVFSVFTRLTLAEKSSASGINVQGLQPYSAIAFAVDEPDSLDNPKLDLVISRIGGTAQVYENISQKGAMSEFSPPTFTVFEGAAPPSGVRGLSASDIDNDGDVDFFAAAATNPRLYINQGPGSSPRFIDVADDNNLSSSAANSWGGTWADYDRDGWVDLYVNCAGGTATPTGITPGIDRLFRSQGIVNGVVDFLDTGASVGLCGGQNSTLSAAWGDADADGDLDLFVGFLPVDTASAGEHSILYLNDNDGTFREIALENFISGGSGFPRIGYVSGAVWLDADRDGLMDLAISRQDPNPGPSTMYNNLEILRNLGAGEFDRSATIDLDAAITAKMQGLSVGDLDLDGWPDLVAVPVSAGVAPPIMLNDISSASEFTNHASQLGIGTGAAQGTVLADFNLDGDPDLYLGRSSNFFYQNVSQEEAGTIVSDEPDAAWVQIRLVSTTKGNNRMGIGARVTVDADGDSLISFVDGGSGRGGQTPGILTFGLGGYSGANVDAYVRWPDGYKQGPISANVGELKTITDDHSPSLIPSLVGLVAVTRPGGLVDWQFHWYTDYSADISQDYVEIVNPSLTLHPGDTNVQHAVIPLATGGYRHELTWKNQSCVPGTTVQYKVGSAVYGSPAEESALKTTKIKVCVQ